MYNHILPFSKDSKNLLNYINKIIKNNNFFASFIKKINSNQKESNIKVYNLINKFYSIFLISQKNIEKYFLNTKNLNNKPLLKKEYYSSIKFFDFNYVNNLLENQFTGRLISNIINEIKYKKIIRIENFSIEIFYNESYLNEINNLIFHLILIYDILKKFFNKKQNFKLNLVVFYIDIKKEYDYNKNYISTENINSGFYFNKQIILYRKEEILKVYIHEILHLFGLDDLNYLKKNNDKKLVEIFNLNSFNFFNESYIEFFAIIFHTLYISCLYSKAYNSIFFNFEKFMKYEIIFSLIQTSKFLNYHNLEFLDFFKRIIYNKYKENTNSFSYIYLKFLLLFNYNKFLDYSIKYGKPVTFNENLVIEYLKFLNYNNNFDYLNSIINKCIIYLKKNTNKRLLTLFYKNSRLSLIEINF